jgi:transposase
MAKFKLSTRKNMKFIASDELYERFINKDSTLVKIHDLVDFDFYRRVLEELYSEEGRAAYDCVLMFKLCIIQFFRNGLSDREVIADAKANMEYRYFLDLAIDDELPHFTKVGCFRARLGEETFTELFEMFVSNLKELGIITKDEVRYMDATHQLADVAKVSINTLLANACKHVVTEINNCEKFIPTTKIDLSVKDFLLNNTEQKSRFVLLVELAHELQEKSLEILSKTDIPGLKEKYDILCRIVKERSEEKDGKVIKKNSKDTGKIASVTDTDATWGAKSKDYQFLGYKHNVTATETGFIEVISTHQGHKGDESFYLEDAKKVDGEKIVADNKYGTAENRRKSKEMNIQLVSPCRKNMKAHLWDDVMDEAFLYNKKDQYKKEMKKRGSLIEGIFGCLKEKNHLRRAKYRGITKVRIQGLMTAFVWNLKALVKWFDTAVALKN